jgi:putative DNA primase/helicase
LDDGRQGAIDVKHSGSDEGDLELLAGTDGFHLSDVGNSDRLIAHAGGLLRYVRAWDSWIVFRQGRFVRDARNAIVTQFAKKVPETMLANLPPAGTRPATNGSGKTVDQRSREIAWAKHSESATALRAMVDISRGNPGVMVDHQDLDADPELLNVRNGTLNLRTGEFRDHDPADLLTMQTSVTFDADATAPLWEECLRTWQPDPEVRRYLQVRAGACATGRPTQSLDIDYGGGGNGKSLFHRTIGSVLGEYAVVPDASLLTVQKHSEHPTAVASLFRARCAVGGETRAQAALNEAMVKNLTGSDPLQARRMREDFWKFDPSHTLILFSNHRPRIDGRDEGIWRRLRLVEWGVTIPEADRDPDLDRKLEAEAPGILNWVLEGARTFLAEGLAVPDSVRAATASYRQAEDITGRFVADALTISPNVVTPAAEIVEAAREWATDLGLDRAPSAKAIAAALEQAGCKNLGQVRIAGHKKSCWSGVAISAGQRVVPTLSTEFRLSAIGTQKGSLGEQPEDGRHPRQRVVDGCRECHLPIVESSPVDPAWCIDCHAEDVRRDALEWST